MNFEYHLFIIWENARKKEDTILNDISNSFEILYKINVNWSKSNFSKNLTRFYGVNLPPNSGKEQHIGVGDFLVVIVKDKEAEYGHHVTSKGKKYINSRTFLAKTKYRDLTGGGHKIHGTNTKQEFSHDFALLFGVPIEEFIDKNPIEVKKVMNYSADLVGTNGWDNLTQVFNVLNLTDDYVVMRNFTPLPGNFYSGEHGDIDFLVGDLESARYTLDAKAVFQEPYRVHYKIRVGDEDVFLDLRYVGDGYYDTKWQNNILKNKTQYNSVNVMKKRDHFYSLLYHALIHKPGVATDYITTLSDLNKNNKFTVDLIDEAWFSSAGPSELLGVFLASNKLSITKAEPSVFYNKENVDKCQDALLRATQTQEIIKKFNFDSVITFNSGPQTDERRYFKAKKDNKEYFIKSGSRSYENEFRLAKKVYETDDNHFVKPIEFHDGEVNYLVTEWIDGIVLEDFLKENTPTNKQIQDFTKDIYNIQNALISTGVVHRDVIPRNFIINDGHLKLIDFYWAIESSQYSEYDYINEDIYLINRLGEDFAAGEFLWDDAVSFSKIARLISSEKLNNQLIKKIEARIGNVTVKPSEVTLKKSLDSYYNKNLRQRYEIDVLSARNDELESHIRDLQTRYSELEARSEELANINSNLVNSASWRATKLLRSVNSQVRKIRKR